MTDKRVESMQIDLDELVSLRQQLAECQAREKVLRDALEWINSRFADVSALVVIREALALSATPATSRPTIHSARSN
jgi:hypothetical protein